MKYMTLGDSEGDRILYNNIRARFQQIYHEANEPEGAGLYHSVDNEGHVRVLRLNEVAVESCSQLLEEFPHWKEFNPSLAFRFIWIAGDKRLNNPKRSD